MEKGSKVRRHIAKGQVLQDSGAPPLIYSSGRKDSQPNEFLDADSVAIFAPTGDTQQSADEAHSELEQRLKKDFENIYDITKVPTKDGAEILTAAPKGSKDSKGSKDPVFTVKKSSREAETGGDVHGLEITLSNPEKHPELLKLVQDFVPPGHIVIVDQCGGKEAAVALIEQFKGAIKFSDTAFANFSAADKRDVQALLTSPKNRAKM